MRPADRDGRRQRCSNGYPLGEHHHANRVSTIPVDLTGRATFQGWRCVFVEVKIPLAGDHPLSSGFDEQPGMTLWVAWESLTWADGMLIEGDEQDGTWEWLRKASEDLARQDAQELSDDC